MPYLASANVVGRNRLRFEYFVPVPKSLKFMNILYPSQKIQKFIFMGLLIEFPSVDDLFGAKSCNRLLVH